MTGPVGRQAGAVQGIFLGILSTLSTAAVVLIAPILPRMTEHFSADPDAEFEVILALIAPALVVAVLSTFVGKLVDGVSRRSVLMVSLFIYGVCGLAPLFLDNLWQIIISRFGVGIAEAGVMTTSATLVADYFRNEERQHWLVIHTVCGSVSAVVFMLVGGLLGALDWRYPFIVYAIGLIAIPLSVFILFEPKAHAEDEPSLGLGFPWRNVLPLYAVGLLTATLFFIVPIQVPFLMTQRGLASPDLIGVTSAVGAIAVPIGSFVYRKTLKLPLFRHMTMAFLFMAVGLCLLVGNGTYWMMFAGVVTASLGSGIALPALFSSVMNRVHYYMRGRGAGGWMTVFFLGNFVSPVLTLGLTKGFGSLPNAILVYASVAATAFVLTAVGTMRPSEPTTRLV